MSEYKLVNDSFVIENFDKKAPFTSFLPGLAGVEGIPIWSFYVNRGQGVTSLGIHHKDNAIMEFFPANVAYENTTTKGFRTLVRANGEYFEPFFTANVKNVKRDFYIKSNSFKIEETDLNNSLKTTVEYFILPNENVGAITRRVKFENIGDTNLDLEILDGMAKIIPYGIKGSDYVRMANLFRSFNKMNNFENKIPVFTIGLSGEDSDQVTQIFGGNFYLSYVNGELTAPVYDPTAVFSEDTSLITPINFIEGGLDFINNYKQVSTNKICCCLTPIKTTLSPSKVITVDTLVGYTESDEFINQKAKEINPTYLNKKLDEANQITVDLTKEVEINTADKVFDSYIKQCYLDNFLRGGYPFVFNKDTDPKVVHLFSRKHGDPERDYNFFSIAGEFYSQGNGNFRDVNQNRRNDCLLHPEVGDFNIKTFFSLLGADAYNPLVVKGSTFTLKDKAGLESLIKNRVKTKGEVVQKLCSKNFTPGQVVNGMYHQGVELNCDYNTFLGELLELTTQNIESFTDSAYWSDHWVYNLDLIEDYLRVFPDKLENLVFSNNTYRYFQTEYTVKPRSQKYYLYNGSVRQFNPTYLDNDKLNSGVIKDKSNWQKTANGEIYQTNLFEKLVSLIANKFSLLDPYGLGIEMESGRPGWNDSMNGLPSFFGSGTGETIELKRVLKFVKETCETVQTNEQAIPVELFEFIKGIEKVLNENLTDFDYWDKIATIREDYREKVRITFSGETATINTSELLTLVNKMLAKLENSIQKAVEFGNGLIPTYLSYEATEYELIKDENGNSKTGYNDLPLVKVKEFKPKALPAFLEGPAKYIATSNKESAKEMFERVKNSGIYDKVLKMFKTSESIEDMSLEIGRTRSFTPGWQERESIFLHMEYKFVLGLIEAGLYDNYFEELKNVFVPFMDPSKYGRSILENCSFIASSSNPDETLHGRGFVSRLSGSTSEVISMFAQMCYGNHPFSIVDGKLALTLRPVMPEWLFDENGEISFAFLSNSTVTLHSKVKAATYKSEIDYLVIDGEKVEGDTYFGEKIDAIRNGNSVKIDIYYK